MHNLSMKFVSLRSEKMVQLLLLGGGTLLYSLLPPNKQYRLVVHLKKIEKSLSKNKKVDIKYIKIYYVYVVFKFLFIYIHIYKYI